MIFVLWQFKWQNVIDWTVHNVTFFFLLVNRCGTLGLIEQFPGNKTHDSLCYKHGTLPWQPVPSAVEFDGCFDNLPTVFSCTFICDWTPIIWRIRLNLHLIFLQKRTETEASLIYSSASALFCSLSPSSFMWLSLVQSISGSMLQVSNTATLMVIYCKKYVQLLNQLGCN